MSAPHILMGLAWLAGWVLFWRAPRLPRLRDEESDADPITVIIPARNEAATLPLLLGDLAEHRPPGVRVIVVDDQSEDDTAAIAGGFHFVEVVQSEPAPEGWCGKTWACHQGARRAGEGMLVFLDADVRLHDDAIARAVSNCRGRGGLLSVWPYHDVKRPYEHLSALSTVVTWMAVGAGSLVPPRRPSTAFGPFMVMSADDYRKTGGHEAVRGSVVEDFAIARRFRDAGLPVANYAGRSSVSFRMYPNGLRDLIDGWTKNHGPGAWHLQPLRFAAMLFWLAFALGLTKWGGGLPRTIPTIFYGLFAVQMFVMFRRVGRFGIVDAILYPVYVVVLALLLLRSLWRTYVVRNVTWKGRRISVGGGR